LHGTRPLTHAARSPLVAERGSDLEFDSAGATVGAPTIVLEGVSLIAM